MPYFTTIPRGLLWENVILLPPAPGSVGQVQSLFLCGSSDKGDKVPLGGGRGKGHFTDEKALVIKLGDGEGSSTW